MILAGLGRRGGAVLLAAVAAIAARAGDGPATEDAAARELARLQGVWRLESHIVDGESSPATKTKSWLLVIEGEIYNPGSGQTSVEYTMRVDPTRNPKAIDLIPREGARRGRTFRGIYALSGSTLTICRVLDPDLDRPAAFVAGPDSGRVLVIWRRRGP